MTLVQELKDSERAGFIKQIADKLFQGIRTVNDKGESRRWIWELVQNAKDIPNKNGTAKIRLELNEDELRFEHNGDPFTISSLTGLLQQVSDKSSKPLDNSTTGKFGTGFITTHILSKKVTVNGIFNFTGGSKKFSIELDREAEHPEELITKVEELMRQKDRLADDELYPPLDNNYVAKDFETQFKYKLTRDTIKFAKQGVEDLKRLAIYTLLFNHKIESLSIVDNIESSYVTITRTDEWEGNGLSYLSVDAKDELGNIIFQQSVAYISNDTFTLAIPVTIQNRQLDKVLPKPDYVPSLFKDLPLIGTENWLLPLVCNCTSFEPTEPRDGLYLHQEGEELSSQVQSNRELVRKAMNLTADFVELLAKESSKPKDLFLLCRSGIPQKEKQADVVTLLNDIQSAYRDRIKSISLVLTPDGYKPMSECRFPFLAGNESADAAKNFYEVCKKPFANSVPIDTHFEQWLPIISEEPDVWGANLTLTITDLLDYIQGSDRISGMLDHNIQNVISWLNTVYQFLIENGYSDVFRDYRLLPNQAEELIFLKDAQLDKENIIPEILKDCGNQFDKPYRKSLLFPNICCSLVTNELTIETISNELNEAIGRLSLKPASITTEQLSAMAKMCNVIVDSTTDERRLKLTTHLSRLIPEWRDSPLHFPRLKTVFNFDPTIKAISRYCLYKVSICETVDALVTELQFETKELALKWVDEFLSILNNSISDLKTLPIEYAVFPNQLGELCFAKDLAVDVDVIEDLIKNMHETLRPDGRPRKKLLHNGFNNTHVDNKYYFREMANDIDIQLEYNFNHKTDTHENALKMIDWTSDLKNKDYKQFFPRLESNKASIVLDSLPDKKEPVFKLLRLQPDFEKLTTIAESKHFELFNEIAQSNVDLLQLNRLYNLATELGGVDELEKIAENYIEEKVDLEFQKGLGGHVESLFEAAFSDFGDTFRVERQGFEHGQDFALIFPNGFIYRIEIKSFASGKERVHMSIRQGNTAAEHPIAYALCVLERPATLSLATTDYFKNNALFVSDIGFRLKPKVKAALEIKNLIDNQQSDEESVAFDSTAYKFRVGKKVWSSKSGLRFNEFINELRDQISNSLK